MLEVVAVLVIVAGLKVSALLLYLYLLRKPLVCDEIDVTWNASWTQSFAMPANNNAVPEVVVTNTSAGLASYIDSGGMMHIDHGSPVGQAESNDSPIVGGPVVGNVIPLFRATGDE